MTKDNTDPLATGLMSIARHHGINTTKDALTAGLPLVNSRLTPTLVTRAADRIGLVSSIAKGGLSELRSGFFPVLLPLKDDQSCVVQALDKAAGTANVSYPELPDSIVEVPLKELEEQSTGFAILLRPRFRFDERSPSMSRAGHGHWFWSAIRENSAVYRDVLLAAFLINVFALAVPLFTMNVYDRVVPNFAVETLWALAIGVGLVIVADASLRMVRSYFLDLASRRVDIKLSGLIMERVLGMQLASRPASAGSFAANLRSFETVRDFITSASIATLIDIPFGLLFFAVIGWLAPVMLIPLFLGVVVILGYALATRRKMEELTETTYRASALRNATLVESLVGLETLKAIGAESYMQRRWEQTASFLAHAGVQLRLLGTSGVSITQWAQQTVFVFVIVLGVYLIADAQLTMGGLIACSMLTSRALGPLAQLSGLIAQYHNASTALKSLNEIMARPVERPPEKTFLSRTHFYGDIEFKNVSFSYPEAELESLRGVSFKVKRGEHVALLGRVGSGKSTLQKLAMGLYSPSKGSVSIDGIDVRQLDPAELRHHVGYVAQDVTLFYGTLRDNLTMAQPFVDDAALIRAAEIAGLADLINSHPKGFDMPISERGDSLSGGQRKAVALARGIINDPRVLLLDEPTDSMDHATEVALRARLLEYCADKTILLVTHRTSLLEIVDRIVVVDDGKIVADGPKEQVMEALRQGRIGKAAQ